MVAAPELQRVPVSVATRRAVAADAEALADLSTQLGYPTTVAAARRRLARIVGEQGHALLVAESASADVIGWVHVFVALRLESDSFAELGGLVVAPESRGRGAGRLLVDAAARWSSEQGLRTLRVRSNVVRHEANAFYSHLGFDQTKSQTVFARRLDG